LHTLVHHARREILLTHPFMIVGQIQVALVVETKLALRTDRRSDDEYSFTNIKSKISYTFDQRFIHVCKQRWEKKGEKRKRERCYSVPYIPAPVYASRISDASSALRWI